MMTSRHSEDLNAIGNIILLDFKVTILELSHCERDYGLQSLKYSLSGPL